MTKRQTEIIKDNLRAYKKILVISKLQKKTAEKDFMFLQVKKEKILDHGQNIAITLTI